MNLTILTGRLTKDPEIRYSQEKAIAKFTLAVDRPMKKDEADFIQVTVFGKPAEFVEKYIKKGNLIGITGRINTGSYEKDGKKIYTTDVIADRVESLGGKKEETTRTEVKKGDPIEEPVRFDTPPADEQIPFGFSQLSDDDIPF
mgnify:CR=1 FL=1